MNQASPDSAFRDAEQVLAGLGSTPEGLSETEAGRRLRETGPNELPVRPPEPAWRILARQFRGVVVLLLVAATGVAFLLGDRIEALAILVVLVVNAGLGFVTELRAHRAMEGLRRLGVKEARVRREGRVRSIAATQVVPGDVLVLEAGEAIPADARLLQARELRLNEATLTGESVPCLKGSAPLQPSETPLPLADLANFVFKGTLVTSGGGEAVVVATGPGTQLGRIARLVEDTEDEPSPLEQQLDRLGRRLVWLVLLVAVVVAGTGLLRGADPGLMLKTALALAIAAVPEGLPAVATITLALGMRRMARRNALVRNLPAVETLGSCTAICTDKTGTLTAGIMSVARYVTPGREFEVEAHGYGPTATFDPPETGALETALLSGLLPNRAGIREEDDGWVLEGDPTEGALVAAAASAGLRREEVLERWPEVAELPFSSERGFMATLHRGEDGSVTWAKGAPEHLLPRCDAEWEGVELADDDRRRWLDRAEAMGSEGLRVLALARSGPGAAQGDTLAEDDVRGLHLAGLVGLRDPPDAGVASTVLLLRRAGVRTVMITGDQAATARSVAEELGVLEAWETTLGGAEFLALDDDGLRLAVSDVGVFSRIDPEGKLRIVDALQDRGEVVGMLGDGVNDAAALRSADVGVAMGIRGTEVARDTSDLVLLDDRFQTVAAAVEEGRVIFDNIRAFIFYLFSCNLSEVLVLLLAGLAGLPLPLLPLQILWLNLVTDVLPALALAVEPPRADVMSRPPRDPGRAILSGRFLSSVGLHGGLLTAATLGVYLWALGSPSTTPVQATTVAFTALAFTQLFHVVNARDVRPVLWTRRMLRNRWLGLGVGAAVALQVLAVQWGPLQAVLRTESLPGSIWAVALGVAVLPVLVSQVARARRSASSVPGPPPEAPSAPESSSPAGP
jgi:Ca2+-transporting ATPase